MKRPKKMDQIILEAARIVGSVVEGNANDIARCYSENINGYELAKKLESQFSWEISVDMIHSLDHLHREVENIYEEVLKNGLSLTK
jgi:hypothetical protein